jgi:hypothetical protein
MPEIDKGVYKIKCVKVGGHTLTKYGQKAFAENEELDLLDDATPATIRAADWWTADNMCRDTGFEIAQLIAAGDFVVVEKRRPDLSNMTQP